MARPLKATKAGGQVTIGLRVPAELKMRLEAEATEQDRNLSQEAERRLWRSFDADDLLSDAVDLILEKGGINSAEGQEFAVRALSLLCGREPAELGAYLAGSLGLTRMMKRTGSGKLRLKKEEIDRLKAAIRELERECVIVAEKE